MPFDSEYRWEKKKDKNLQVKFNLVPKTRLKPFSRYFPGFGPGGMVQSDPGGFLLPSVFNEYGNAETIYNFKPRTDDVWVITFPKCGNNCQL